MATADTCGRTVEELQSNLAAIGDSSGDAIVGKRLDGVIEAWNQGAERLYGYAAPEVIGRHISLLEPPELSGEIAGILARLARGEAIHPHRTLRLRKDGQRVSVSVTVSPIRDAAGRVVGAYTIGRDIEERYRSFALAGAQIVWTGNAHGELVGDSPTWRAFTGQRADEITGRGWTMAIHPDDRERIFMVFADGLKSGAVCEAEYRLLRRDGEYRYVAARGVPVRDPGGRVREWVGSCIDITERKRAEEEARRSQRELALNTRLATIFLTLSQREMFAAVLRAILDHTQSEDGIFGYIDESGALVIPIRTWGERDPSFAPGEAIRLRRQEWIGIWGRALSEGRSLYSNQPTPSPEGGASVRRVLATPIFFQKEPIGLLAIANQATDYGAPDRETLERIARDIAPILKARLRRDAQERAWERAEEEIRTMNAELEQRVQERTAQLEAANQELEAFAYSVSHDLRAPLRAIHGFSRILMEQYAPQLSAECRRHLEVVHCNALQMGKLIEDLLSFSRLSRQPLRKQPIAPADLVKQALHDLIPEIDPRIGIVVGDLPPCQGDPALLKQVFVNLLSNAIKYSSRRAPARIEVGAQAPVYFVRDNGAGFDMRNAHKLFGVFQRLHNASDYPGTGIGLATVQRILHRHGGRIWAEAEVDRGATFYFTMEPEPRGADS
jgi:PAS domain S-box-containing protein